MVPGNKIKAVILVVMAVVLASGSIGAVYACYEPPYYPPYHPGQTTRVDLKICDEDETWADGVSETWMASNMVPGDEFDFNGCFTGLSGEFPRWGNMGLLGITCQYNSWAPYQPDRMARYMVITSCTYEYTNNNETWQINCLTGRATKISRKGYNSFLVNRDWQIQDVDRDGRITFADLKRRPLRNLPLFSDDEADFTMGVRFDESAGNEFQGDTFTLKMIYTLIAW
jgi:hypothetical protein